MLIRNKLDWHSATHQVIFFGVVSVTVVKLVLNAYIAQPYPRLIFHEISAEFRDGKPFEVFRPLYAE